MTSSPAHLRTSLGLRAAFVIALWTLALAILLLVVAGSKAPLATEQVSAVVFVWLGRIGIGATAVLLIALILWPPAIPALRVGWKRFRDRLDVDHGALLEAKNRLAHFESAPDQLVVGRTLLRLGQPRRAIPHLVRATQLEPESVQAAHLCGKALLEAGGPELAARALEHAVSIDPAYAFGDLLHDYGTALWRLGRDADAEVALARFEARFGPSPSVDMLRGKVNERLGDLARARELFARAAAKPQEAAPVSAADRLARARARVALWRIGGTR